MEQPSQTVTMLLEYRFPESVREVFIRREGESVVLTPRPTDWSGFFASFRYDGLCRIHGRKQMHADSGVHVLVAQLFMLDTDTCIFLMRGMSQMLAAKVQSVPLQQQVKTLHAKASSDG